MYAGSGRSRPRARIRYEKVVEFRKQITKIPIPGPMVYGIAFCPLSDGEVLKTLGCADSKQLTEETRDIIFDDINRKEYASTTVGYVRLHGFNV